jgi:hypothetical protein
MEREKKAEIAFDMVSAVDELNKQVGLEFDFVRVARIQDAVARHLGGLAAVVAVPRSVPGLVTMRLLTVGFVEGDQIERLEVRKGLSFKHTCHHSAGAIASSLHLNFYFCNCSNTAAASTHPTQAVGPLYPSPQTPPPAHSVVAVGPPHAAPQSSSGTCSLKMKWSHVRPAWS